MYIFVHVFIFENNNFTNVALIYNFNNAIIQYVNYKLIINIIMCMLYITNIYHTYTLYNLIILWYDIHLIINLQK